MKNFTFTVLLAAIALGLAAQQPVKKWQGASSDKWDNVSANWVPLTGLPFPTSFVQGDDVLLDDSRNEGKDTIMVVGEIQAKNISFKNSSTKPYYIGATDATSKITGTGAIYKDNTGEVIIGVKSELAGGVVVKNGYLSANDPANSVNPFGPKITFKGGGVKTHYKAVDSPTYSNSVDMEVATGDSGNLFVPRRINLKGDLKGAGKLNLMTTGERIFADFRNGADWSGFSGTIQILKSVPAAYAPGFYGLGLITDSAYNATSDVETGLFTGTGINNMLSKVKFHMGHKTALYSESGTRCYRIGELTAEDDSCEIYGYYKSSTTPVIYYQIGSLNTHVVLPARIRPQASDAAGMPRRDNKVGIIKEGTGTYTLTNGNNFITAGIDIHEGKLFISNPAKTESGTGYHMSWGSMVIARKGSQLGGTGRISGNVEIWGTLAPGENGIGTLTVGDRFSRLDSADRRFFEVILRPEATLEIELASATSHDRLITDSIRMNGTLKVVLASSYNLKAGDTFKIIEGIPSSKSTGFTSVILPKSSEGWGWDTTKLRNEGIIKLLSGGGSGTTFSADRKLVEDEITLYPNPSRGNFNLVLPAEKCFSVRVLNSTGVSVHSQPVNSSKMTIRPGRLAGGVYFVEISTTEGRVVKKMIIQD